MSTVKAQEACTEFCRKSVTWVDFIWTTAWWCTVKVKDVLFSLCLHVITFLIVVKFWSRELHLLQKSGHTFKIVSYSMFYHGDMMLVMVYFSLFLSGYGILISHFAWSPSHTIPVSHPPPSDPLLSIYWHVIVIQPLSPDMLRCGEKLYSCSVLKSVCSLIHRKLLEIWRWWSNKSSTSAL